MESGLRKSITTSSRSNPCSPHLCSIARIIPSRSIYSSMIGSLAATTPSGPIATKQFGYCSSRRTRSRHKYHKGASYLSNLLLSRMKGIRSNFSGDILRLLFPVDSVMGTHVLPCVQRVPPTGEVLPLSSLSDGFAKSLQAHLDARAVARFEGELYRKLPQPIVISLRAQFYRCHGAGVDGGQGKSSCSGHRRRRHGSRYMVGG